MLNYTESIELLFSKLPMFNRVGAAAIKKNIDNTVALCERLGNPHHQFKTIHIAGTNGKGSVSHTMAAILQTAGYKTGLYTSPHLFDFRERMRVNGEKINKDFVSAFTTKTAPWFDEIEPSFFEITVAMAFDYFANQKVDIAVIEVGLGGRTDSTNIISPELSVITNIGWDHMNLLGNTLPEIAWEKAGIIKSNIPVVIGETQNEIVNVFEEEAKLVNTSLFFADNFHKIKNYDFIENHLQVEIESYNNPTTKVYNLELTGLYQQKNLWGKDFYPTVIFIDVMPEHREFIENNQSKKVYNANFNQEYYHLGLLQHMFNDISITVPFDCFFNEPKFLQQIEYLDSELELNLNFDLVKDLYKNWIHESLLVWKL